MKKVINLVVYRIDQTGIPHFYVPFTDSPIIIKLTEVSQQKLIEDWLVEKLGTTQESLQTMEFEKMVFVLCQVAADNEYPTPQLWMTSASAQDSPWCSGRICILLQAAHAAITSN